MSQRKHILSKVGKGGISGMFSWGKLGACYTAVYSWNKNIYTEISGVCYMPEYIVNNAAVAVKPLA